MGDGGGEDVDATLLKLGDARGNGQLLDRAKNGKRRPTDVFVPKELIRRFKLRQGSLVAGTAYPAEGKFPNPKMKFIEKVRDIVPGALVMLAGVVLLSLAS